jgi:hypothetical protein
MMFGRLVVVRTRTNGSTDSKTMKIYNIWNHPPEYTLTPGVFKCFVHYINMLFNFIVYCKLLYASSKRKLFVKTACKKVGSMFRCTVNIRT